MTKIRTLLAQEPVRVYLYGVAVAVAALLVALGVLDPELKDVLLGLVSSLLVVGGVEKARSKVSPTDA